MGVTRRVQLALVIVIANAALALWSPPPAHAEPICVSHQGWCEDTPCTQQNWRTICRQILGITCPCSVCEGFCVNLQTCEWGQTRGYVTCYIGGPDMPCP
ncbi:MAG TPA: hypothetical protein VJQ52_22430 [Steroidobacteraceae bacterium]|nr:hypothetical protein [Steroidobacteraceae bacterium]